MNVIVENSANLAMNYIFYYNLGYSLKNAVETDDDIRFYINKLAEFPYSGRYVAEISDKHFREIIYKRTRKSCYRIIYYISELSNTIYVLNILNSKQDFHNFLKSNDYFKNYFKY